MDYKIVLDSCGELTYKMKESGIYHTAVLSMLVDGDTILDDESFDRERFSEKSSGESGMSEVFLSFAGCIYGTLRRSGEEGLCGDLVSGIKRIV